MLEPPCLPRSTQGEKEVNKKLGEDGTKKKKKKGEGVIRYSERTDMQDNPIERVMLMIGRKGCNISCFFKQSCYYYYYNK